MAVVDKYVNALFEGTSALVQKLAPGVRLPSLRSKGEKTVTLIETFEIAAGDDDGSIYRVFKGVPTGLRIFRIAVMCDAITGSTDNDLGCYLTEGGAVISKDKFMDGQTLASASKVLNGFANVIIENYGKTIAEHLGYTVVTDKQFVDICLTANTVGTADGTVTVILEGAMA